MKKGEYTISYCICPQCGKGFPIPRKANKCREKDHIKDLWCPFCKEVVSMKEMRYNDYEEVMIYGNI